MAPEETQPGVSESPGESMDTLDPASEAPGMAAEPDMAIPAPAETLHQRAPEEAILTELPQIIDTSRTEEKEEVAEIYSAEEIAAASVPEVHVDVPPNTEKAPEEDTAPHVASVEVKEVEELEEKIQQELEVPAPVDIAPKELETEPALPAMANEDIIVGEDLQDADVEMEDQSAKSAEEPSAVKEKTRDASGSEKKKPKKNSIDPNFVMPVVKKGDDEYHVIIRGVKDTGLCGKYWADMNQLPSKRQRKSLVSSQPDSPAPPTKAPTPPSGKRVGRPPRPRNDGSSSHSEAPLTPTGSSQSRSSRTSSESSIPGTSVASTSKPVVAVKTSATPKVTPSEVEKTPKRKSDNEGESSANKIPRVTTKGKSEVNGKHNDELNTSRGKRSTENGSTAVNGENPNTRKEVDKAVSDYFASHRSHTWVNIGKRNDGAKPESVQYARALRPPYHLLSFLKIQGHSNKGRSYTDKNTLVFIVLEGDVTIQLNDMHFEAEKGDSFYIPPKNNYNILNKSSSPAELSLIQFQYDGNSFGDQQNQANQQAQRSN